MLRVVGGVKAVGAARVRTLSPIVAAADVGSNRHPCGFTYSPVHSKTDQPAADGMDNPQKQQQTLKKGDVMTNSFGEGYSTRSDEEGFGGTYGENQSLPNPSRQNDVPENHPEYDRSQGSEVKEKEKGRHQTNANG
ncbi:uncharacterized protein LOC131148487 [Malania oleifera]|uniref:uncharacterized protein LOC131148487 n=1 Tax=Malania oleifera TaxID=397392 RepID=UPI0025ADEB8C|nr:uncharacterized protein LOC131148487 [Malania oleifera]